MRLPGLLLIAIFVASPSPGQIPNSGFENWVTDLDSNSNPIAWETTNSFPLVNVDRVSPGCSGNYAMRVKTLNPGFPFPGIAILQAAYSLGQAPTKLAACVRATIMPGDVAYLIVGLMKGDSVIAATADCTFKIDTSLTQFTHLEFPIALVSSLVPDSLIVMVASGLATGQVGTEVIVDDIELITGTTTDLPRAGSLPDAFALHQNHPNPFNPATRITYALPSPGVVSLVVYDILGRPVAVLADGSEEAGVHEAVFEARGLPSGVYLYRLKVGDFAQTRRLLLLR